MSVGESIHPDTNAIGSSWKRVNLSPILVVLVVVMSLLGCSSRSGFKENQRQALWPRQPIKRLNATALLREVRLGDPEDKVRNSMADFEEEDWSLFENQFLRLRIFKDHRAGIWLVGPRTLNRSVGGEEYVVAVFSGARRLEDLLVFRPNLSLKPLVRGQYARNLEAIRPGMNIDDLYSRVGHQRPGSYFRTDEGRWQVTFTIEGVGLESWVYEVDAATGVITKAWVSLI